MRENYFWNTVDVKPEKKVYILIIYDIVGNKRRTAFAKKMNGYGFRVQKSAFEAMVPEKLYKKLLEEIPRLISEEEDSVRLYRISGQGEVSLFGVNETIKDEEVIII
ncbi:MAG: CRISPR-associated endonuclease Cas2 [Lachnospiraceae bacterium]|nr:CRISPR-associated endonuclease Cas2 [Lachnospiraceae bacterium]